MDETVISAAREPFSLFNIDPSEWYAGLVFANQLSCIAALLQTT
jgi:hypothetical protein